MTDRLQRLEQANRELAELLAADEPARLAPAHGADELMVWFLLGGKDVGKSTFLNALLDAEVSPEAAERAEGTSRFVAYVHEQLRPQLEQRLNGLPMILHLHTNDDQRNLCLIDSPDFDSRYRGHADQVRGAIEAGAADGVVLLASPAKYKDHDYWEAFGRLAVALSPRHVLFALTKADELGQYLEQVRADFAATVRRRMGLADRGDGDQSTRVFLIDSPGRALDFPRLRQRLLRRLSAADVNDAQRDNLRHALDYGRNSIREHYRLDEIESGLDAASDPARIAQAFDEHLGPAYFAALSARLARHRGLAAAVREELWELSGRSLAGASAVLALLRWIGSHRPLRLRAGGGDEPAPAELAGLLRWGGEDLSALLDRARRDAFQGVGLERTEALERHLQQPDSTLDDLARLLEDHLARPVKRLLSWPLRLLLNLPVYLYLVFFVCLLFYPALLLLQGWGVVRAPQLAGLLTLDNVKVALVGFCGYYLMAALFVVRLSRDRVRRETEGLAERFSADARELLLRETARPLARFSEDFELIKSRLAIGSD